VTAAAFGIGGVLLGNAPRLAGLIARGELDFYLPLPKPVLLHVLASRMSLVSLGDVAFGFVAFELTRPTWMQRLLFVFCALAGTVVVISFAVLAGSLAFWLGNAQSAAGQMYNALIHFSTFPSGIFKGGARLLLYSLIPAAFIAGIPVALLRAPTEWLVLQETAAALLLAGAAGVVFRTGLRRYTSGNLLSVRE
jgi:ABC-2 type transport system permease protein